MAQVVFRAAARASNCEPLDFCCFSEFRFCASIFCFPLVMLASLPLLSAKTTKATTKVRLQFPAPQLKNIIERRFAQQILRTRIPSVQKTLKLTATLKALEETLVSGAQASRIASTLCAALCPRRLAMVNLGRGVLLLALVSAPALSLSPSAHQCSNHHSDFGSSELSPHGSDQQVLRQAPTHHHHHHESHHHIHGHHDQSPAHYDNEDVLPEELAEEEELAQHGFWSQRRMSNEQSKLYVVWLSALGCSLLVSTASLTCLVLLPFILSNGRPSAAVVDALAGFGAGAMLGDAFLHQLPDAFGGIGHAQHEHGHSNSHHDHGHEVSGAHRHAHSIRDLSLGISVLAGILLFFIVEKLVRYVEENSARTGVLSSHSHHHHKGSSSARGDNKAEDGNEKKGAEGTNCEGKEDKDESAGDTGEKAALKEPVSARPTPSGWVLAYLNLFSDGVHNFTDGMALGSAFLLHGSYGGWSRTLFLLAHELPQEVGDFGILVRSGFSVTKALTFNFLSALLAVGGTALALLLGGNPGHSSLIEGFTAGGFIYISVAGVLPGMHEQGSSLRTAWMQLASLSAGVGVAMAISLAE